MRRLLEDFDDLFDLTHRIGDATLGDLLEQTVAGLGQSSQNWGTEGQRQELLSESGRFVSFYYRPHLFPGMELKLRLAHELQYRLLPQELPPGSPVSIAAVLESYCHLSGDLFGWEVLKDGKFLIWIADMAGHGVRAGLTSAVLRILIGNLRRRSELGSFVSDLNGILHDCIRPKHGNLYATLFAMTIDSTGNAVYCSAAQPPILLRRADGTIEQLEPIDRPVGLFSGTNYREEKIRLEREDCLLLFTDGLIEATGWDNEPFGRERLRKLLAEKTAGPRELTAAIYDEVKNRQDIDKLEDDVTFLAVSF